MNLQNKDGRKTWRREEFLFKILNSVLLTGALVHFQDLTNHFSLGQSLWTGVLATIFSRLSSACLSFLFSLEKCLPVCMMSAKPGVFCQYGPLSGQSPTANLSKPTPQGLKHTLIYELSAPSIYRHLQKGGSSCLARPVWVVKQPHGHRNQVCWVEQRRVCYWTKKEAISRPKPQLPLPYTSPYLAEESETRWVKSIMNSWMNSLNHKLPNIH